VQIQIEHNVKAAYHSPLTARLDRIMLNIFCTKSFRHHRKEFHVRRLRWRWWWCSHKRNWNSPGTIPRMLAPPAPQIYSLLKSGAAARFYFHCLLYISAQSSGRRPQYGWALQYPQCLWVLA